MPVLSFICAVNAHFLLYKNATRFEEVKLKEPTADFGVQVLVFIRRQSYFPRL